MDGESVRILNHNEGPGNNTATDTAICTTEADSVIRTLIMDKWVCIDSESYKGSPGNCTGTDTGTPV